MTDVLATVLADLVAEGDVLDALVADLGEAEWRKSPISSISAFLVSGAISAFPVRRKAWGSARKPKRVSVRLAPRMSPSGFW